MSDVTIRRAVLEDLGAILDLLTEYELPRAYFEPFYLNDPTYRPSQSWVAEQDGTLLAHLRVYDRHIRIGGVPIRVAGLGNVITARSARGQGLAGQLLRDMLAAIHTEGFAYSLLWTHIPDLYARYGWAPIMERTVQAILSHAEAPGIVITPFEERDLPEMMRLYDDVNATRTGATIRTADYWRGQLAWLGSAAREILVARTEDLALVGYVRPRTEPGMVEILELGVARDRPNIGRALLAAAAAPHAGHMEGPLPPSLVSVLHPEERELHETPGLMGRVANFAALTEALRPLWHERLQAVGARDGAFSVRTGGIWCRIRVRAGAIGADAPAPDPAGLTLDEGEFAHLLFHGFDASAGARLAPGHDAALLQVLFPEQDFVIWPADRF